MAKGFINVGRSGVFNGLFGNPVVEKKVSLQYRLHFQKVMKKHPDKIEWLRKELSCGKVMFCPGCGVGSPTCHARVIEQMIGIGMSDPVFN